MGLFEKKHKEKSTEPQDEITAFPIEFTGEGIWGKPLDSGYGISFEDDGETGYFYATDASYSEIYDALWIYNKQDLDALKPGEQVFVVWNPERKMAGLFYRDIFHAIFDFSSKRGVNRAGAPPVSGTSWSPDGHAWDESLVQAFYPNK